MWKLIHLSEGRKRRQFRSRSPNVDYLGVPYSVHPQNVNSIRFVENGQKPNKCESNEWVDVWTNTQADKAIFISSSNSFGADNYSPKLYFVISFPYPTQSGGLVNLNVRFQACHPRKELICPRQIHFLLFRRDILIQLRRSFSNIIIAIIAIQMSSS